MRKKLLGILTLFMVLVVQIAFAQEKTVTGTVLDDEGLPLPGVNVIEKGTNNGAQTDFDGNYSISVGEGSTLVFSYVGFSPKEVVVGSANSYNVTLETDSGALDEVVVMGYVSKKREDLTGSVVQVDSEQLQQTPMASVDQALQGKVSGLQISTSSGTPGATQDIRIRGISSINAGNDPLYVIDGVPVINNNVAGFGSGSSLSALASLNSNDIESIAVLKDASATAAYGARGANGVIVITTKSGKSGKTSVNVSSYYGFTNNATDGPDMLTGAEREILYYEGIVNTYGADYGLSNIDDARDFEATYLGDYAGYIAWNEAGRPEGNWDEVIKNNDAPVQEHTISATGGGDDHNFYTSLGYYKQEATVIGSTFDRITGSLNLTKDITDNLKFTTSNTGSHTFQDGILEGSAYFSSPHTARYFMSPIDQPYNEDGTINLNTGVPNPLYISQNDIDESKLTRILTNNALSWQTPIENLSLTSRVSIDYQVYDAKRYRNRVLGDGSSTDGYGARVSRNTVTYVFQNSIDYLTNFGDHNFDFKLLQEFQKYKRNYLFADGDSFVTDGLSNLASSGNPTSASSEFTDWAVASYLATASYNYDNRYVLNGTFRREGNSRFASDKRWGDFWSVGAAWNLHREEFLSGSDFVNNLKLRASYGKTGNANIGINQYQVLFNYDADYAGSGASYPATYGNEDLTWETGNTFDVGIDFGLWQNRLTGSLAYYRRESKDLLLDVPLSYTTGFSSQFRNIGRMENKGFEAELNVKVVRTDDFNVSLGGNVGTVENEVLEVAQDANGNEIAVTSIYSTYQRSKSGSLVNEWFLPAWAGVDPETGLDTYYTNGEGSEIAASYTQANRVYTGYSALPTISAGMNFHVDFKGFFLDASGYYAGGHKVYESWHRYINQNNLYATAFYNGYDYLLNRWQQPGDVTRVQKSRFAGEPWQYSTKFLHDGDFFRLRNVTVGYDFNPSITEAIGINSARIFVRGTNLYTWVKDDNLLHDPEIDASGFTSITTPPVKSVVLGVNLKL
ncbi:MAG: TonB-dependent receptor [Christiangramia sp.]|uniref:TonB-dependent receptor n=1 Tax=Christiangramia flava JLT2011 TaxID=1229726 RepID=A0A1L7I246_9FLAO|nr:TonB-dependent receptor [Christiangramia flava]APU67687.1 TonB-dependent receptor [Christiangramia flava JLT2011]OSS40191.1 TonB-dependent receptor [Christiangramia flava JLT2011]